MHWPGDKLASAIARLDELVAALPSHQAAEDALHAAVQRWRSDAAACRFHLGRREAGPRLLAVLGGTGTGKSTIVNRLLGFEASSTSLRRTFTSGPVAVGSATTPVPEGWLGVEHVQVPADQLPARGRAGALLVASVENELTRSLTLVDTPDLDGDQPSHLAQADRVFRWTDAILFLVTPEKYQMTELLPYYRLARRYDVPALFLMNKCEETDVLDDYARLLQSQGASVDSAASEASDEERDARPANLFAVARDDAAYQPPAGADLAALREALSGDQLKGREAAGKREGLRRRAQDLIGRLVDQVLGPLREQRREADRLAAALRGMETPAPGIDVNPLTYQLQRRLQQRSILYLIGPQRVLDRVRQAPALLVRLPRVAWDYVMRGEVSPDVLNPNRNGKGQEVPDFRALLIDQFALLRSRIDDVLRSSPVGAQWLGDGKNAAAGDKPAGPGTTSGALMGSEVGSPPWIAPAEAGKIADEELADLKAWLEQRWNAQPRDTRALNALLKHLPGGEKLARWSEAAPYLLTVVLITHHALFGPVDLMVLAGYGLATWLTERVSNEVISRTRATNARIAERFERLSHEQIAKICDWLTRRAPSARDLDRLQRAADEAAELAVQE